MSATGASSSNTSAPYEMGAGDGGSKFGSQTGSLSSMTLSQARTLVMRSWAWAEGEIGDGEGEGEMV